MNGLTRKMTTIIIEDEKPAARLLQRKATKLGLQVHQLIHSVEEAINWFSNNEHPDLIFLDIQLSDGLSFEIFEKINIKSAIIFTTAYDEYALRAFKLNSIDYLLKPIDEEELETAINKFKSRNQSIQNLSVDFEMIKQMFANPFEKIYKKRFTIKIGEHLKMIPIEAVECFYSENKGTYIHTKDNRDYFLTCTLEQLELELNPTSFFKVNRKFIIPLEMIKDIVAYSNSRLKIILPTFKNDEIIVSREKVTEFKTWLG